MPRVVSLAEIEAAAAGGTLTVDADTIVTPLAAAEARARGVVITRAGRGARVEPGASGPALVRSVTRQVIDRIGSSAPEVVEAVVSEVMQAIAQGEAGGLVEVAPGVDYCAACLEQDRSRSRTRAVVTTTGRNTKGIVARITSRVADLGGDILDIAQTLVGDYFTMIIVVDVATLSAPFTDFKDALEAEARTIGVQAMVMHEDVLNSLHRI